MFHRTYYAPRSSKVATALFTLNKMVVCDTTVETIEMDFVKISIYGKKEDCYLVDKIFSEFG